MNIIALLFLGIFWSGLGCNNSASTPNKNQLQETNVTFTSKDTTLDVVVKDSTIEDTDKVSSLTKKFRFRYSLKNPNVELKMTTKLNEISGLSLSNQKDLIYAVQDEKGSVYVLDKKDGKVKHKFGFWKAGDFEGIEIVNDVAYVIKSSGDIFQITDMGKEEQKVKKISTVLRRENDVEGLCYDEANNRLLLACKGRPATGESILDFRQKKAIYGFDLKTLELSLDPIFEVDLNDIQNYLKKQKLTRQIEKLIEFFSPKMENLTFNPSAIAIHPKTADVYITSSVGKVLIVLDKKGKLKHIEKLDKKVHCQPEGLAFEPNGDLYISNEAKEGRKARIYRFDYLED